ncbi:MAG: hypothetical protein JEZ09_15950 [Salinivirgaceae bacterium]|nr:hypothetical protein [Salinivirgaceae bacterium]
MKIWNALSKTEKIMAGMIIIMLLMIALNWTKVSKGLKDGYLPIKKEIQTNNNN